MFAGSPVGALGQAEDLGTGQMVKCERSGDRSTSQSPQSFLSIVVVLDLQRSLPSWDRSTVYRTLVSLEETSDF
jgi:hypothetical protein